MAAAAQESQSWTDDTTSGCQHTFANNSAVPVDLVWCSFDGEDKVYNTLGPGLSTRQETYTTHVWRVTTDEGVVLIEYAGPSAKIDIMPDGYAKVRGIASAQTTEQ